MHANLPETAPYQPRKRVVGGAGAPEPQSAKCRTARLPPLHPPAARPPAAAAMFMLKKKKPQVDTTAQLKAVAWDLAKIAVVFIGIRAASVVLNPDN